MDENFSKTRRNCTEKIKISRIIMKMSKRNKEEFSKKNENSSENYKELHGEEKDFQNNNEYVQKKQEGLSKKDENFSENNEKLHGEEKDLQGNNEDVQKKQEGLLEEG